MNKKRITERMYGTAQLDGESALTAAASFQAAIINLTENAQADGRIVLFDTMEVRITRESVSDGTLLDFATNTARVSTWTTISVSAECVTLPVSETKPSPHIGGEGIAR